MTLAQNAQDPAKLFYDAVIERIVAGGPLPGSSEEPHQALFRALEAMKAEMPILRSALLAEWSAIEEGLDWKAAQEASKSAGVEFPNWVIPQPARTNLERQHRARLAAERQKWVAEVETLKARVEELDRECEATAASVTRWVEHHRKAEARVQRLEGALTKAQFRELDDVLDWAMREKRGQIDALHDADWVRPPEFDVNERDEQWLADFTRKGIDELMAIKVALKNLYALLPEETTK